MKRTAITVYVDHEDHITGPSIRSWVEEALYADTLPEYVLNWTLQITQAQSAVTRRTQS